MTPDQLNVILILITMGVAAFALYKAYSRGEGVTLSSAIEEIKEARPVALELMEIAQIAVNATEQLKREGKIEENDVAFSHALDLVKKWLPNSFRVDNEDIIAAINAAVLVASGLSKQAGRSSEDAPNTRFS